MRNGGGRKRERKGRENERKRGREEERKRGREEERKEVSKEASTVTDEDLAISDRIYGVLQYLAMPIDLYVCVYVSIYHRSFPAPAVKLVWLNYE